MSAAIKKILYILFGGQILGFEIVGEHTKEILSDEKLSDKLLAAIEDEKSGKEKEPIIVLNSKKYKLVRAGEI